MIHDRGAKKWTAMMLPEHKKMLSRLYEELNFKEKPIIDEQQYEQFNQMMQQAMAKTQMMDITYYVNGDFKHIRGMIRDVNVYKGELNILGEEREVHFLSLKDIVHITYANDEIL
jgi:hypothetical protein